MMECPNCGAKEKALVKVCSSCNQAFANQDLLNLYQLTFLVNETAGWRGVSAQRDPYVERLSALRKRILRFKSAGPGEQAATTAIGEAEASLEPIPALTLPEKLPAITKAHEVAPAEVPIENALESKPAAAAPRPAAPPTERVPFDQWLLSERNIKFALYSGGILLVMAGLIFIGVNWSRIPGLLKFAITLTITGLMYLGGYLLFRRPTLKIGGVALLGVASGFLALDFAVLQIYVLGPIGLRDEMMLLIASPLCLLLYALTAYWTKADLFSYASFVAVASTATAALEVAGAPILVYILVYALLSFFILGLARFFQSTSLANFTRQPLLIISQSAMLMVIVAAITGWIATTGCTTCSDGSPWLAIGTLITSVLFYVTSDLLYKWRLMRWASALLFPLTLSLILVEFNIITNAILIGLMIVALIYLLVGYMLERRGMERDGTWPFYITAYGIAGVVSLWTFILFTASLIDKTGVSTHQDVFYIVLYCDVFLLALNNILFKTLVMRWGASLLFPVPFTLTLIDLNFRDTTIAVTLMVVALIYLGAGYFLEHREAKRAAGWPLYTTAYIVAGFVTIMALPKTGDLVLPKTGDLVQVLFGDVLLLAISAAVHRDYRWVYAAVWLFMLPVYQIIYLNVPARHYQGLLMGGLGLFYLAAGCLLSRKELPLGYPFITAAAFLSVVSVALTWKESPTAIVVLFVIACAYLAIAWWRKWVWLMYPSLLAANLIVYHANRFPFSGMSYSKPALYISLFTFGTTLALGGLALRRSRLSNWALPFYVMGGVNLVGSYVAGLTYGGWLAVSLSAAFATLMLAFAWLERQAFIEKQLPPLLSYQGIALLFVGHFFLLNSIGGEQLLELWPGFAAGLCAAFVFVSWALREEMASMIYGQPLNYAGLFMMAIPMVGCLLPREPILVAVTFATASITYIAAAVKGRKVYLAYLGIGTGVVTIWAILVALDITEQQAFVLPACFALLGVGWYERIRGRMRVYVVLSILGLGILTGSAFIQSLPSGAYGYAILLTIECLVALGWGIRKRSRGYVQVGAVALFANAIAQFGPGFIEMPRWIQLAIIGGLLLGAGLAALFKREEILSGRRRLTEKWRQWEP